MLRRPHLDVEDFESINRWICIMTGCSIHNICEGKWSKKDVYRTWNNYFICTKCTWSIR